MVIQRLVKDYLFVFLLFSMVFLPLSMEAQAPRLFSYQAVVRDGNDVLVRGQEVGVRVRILQGSSTGSSVFTETHLPTTNTNGLFTIVVGTGSLVSGGIRSIDWGNGPYFLSVDVDPAGGNDYQINATQQLMSVPYALFADSSASAESNDDIATILGRGNDANAQKISNVKNPTAAQDVSTKFYVDSIANILANSFSAEFRDTMVCLSAGNSITWHGATYDAAGLYFHIMAGAGTDGVDSIIRLHVAIGTGTHNTYSIARCESYTWVANGYIYEESGNYVREYINAQGCPSADTLHLTIHPAYNILDARSECDSLRWDNGVLYTESINGVVQNLQSSQGCDSVVTMNLVVYYSTSGVDRQLSPTPYTWIDGITYYTSTNTPKDTIPNARGCDSVVTLNLLIIHEGALPGTFSVSNSTTVRFAQGNLQYKASAYTWRFAEHQYDIIGNAAGNTAPSVSQSGWIDLFGWGTSGYHNGDDANNTQYVPYSTSTAEVSASYNKYGYGPSTNSASSSLTGLSARYDWGIHNPISNGGNAVGSWRTLTHDEMVYLLETRATTTVNGTPNGRYCKATVNGQTGLIIFPDSYTHPDGVTAPVGINVANAVFSTNVYTADQFGQMEIAGAAFLPAAGTRSGTTVFQVSEYGNYWSSTVYSAEDAYRLCFGASLVDPSFGGHYPDRCVGFAVRLVRETNNVCGYLPRFGTDEIEACDSLRWIDGVKYFNDNNTATCVVQNAAGCDSTVTLNLTIHSSASTIDNRFAEESFTWINGETYYASTNTPKDTLSTTGGCDSVVTLNLTLVPEGGLPGAFTVSTGNTVRFSKGNLQYQGSGDVWRFAAHQYEIIGNAVGNTAPSADQTAWIDLFGWATSGWPGARAYRPYSTSTSNGDYYPGGHGPTNLVGNYRRGDWGINNAIFNGGNQAGMWRVLTQSEWNHLINVRATSNVNGVNNARYCRAVVNGVKGMVLFPDVYVHPQTVAQPTSINSNADFNSNVYTAEQFDLMEKAGAVFLPAAGYRNNSTVNYAGTYGYYWSSTYYYDGSYAYCMYFSTDLNTAKTDERHYGFSVRLVRESNNICGFLPRSSVDVREACDSLRWRNGMKYIASTNTPSVLVYTDRGCDSTVTLNLTIHPSVTNTDVRVSEEPITWNNGVTYYESTNSPVDSLHTVHGCDSIVTLEFTRVDPGILNGTFHVSAGVTVHFSKGNLQYMGITDSWRFAEHQYDYIGNATGNTSPSASQSNWIDLFGWATSGWNSGANAYRPYATSTGYGDYYIRGNQSNSPTGMYVHADWGAHNAISNAENLTGVWRTLTFSEWNYMLNSRSASNVNGVVNARYCKAIVNGINGLIIFPDSYVHPSSVRQPTVINNASAAFSSNNYTIEQFSQMEGRGVVFLPAAGYRSGTTVSSAGSWGRYWSASVYDYYRCYGIGFDNGGYNAGDANDRSLALSVRLVKASDLTPCGYNYRSGVDVREACDSLTWINGVKYVANNNSATCVVQTDAGCDSTVTLNLTIHYSVATTDVRSSESPITWDGVTYSESTDTPIDSLHTSHGCDSIVRLEFTRLVPGIISSTFHVSAVTTVQFSKGNLQYMGSTNTWRFAEHQYDYIGNAAGNTSPSASQANWIDLFGWATSGWNSGANAYRPYATSTGYGDYYIRGSQSNPATGMYILADWGAYNPISNAENIAGVWRTLTYSEWNYLLNSRSASNVNGIANTRYCKAIVNGVNGLIIFPDIYTHPASVRQPTVINNSSAAFSSNNYTAEQFAQMEGRGVVFLPAAGYRSGTSVSSAGSWGRYWSTSTYDYYRCYGIGFDNGGYSAGDANDRSLALSVRLVKASDLTPCGYNYRSGVDVREACDSMTWIDGIKYVANNNSATCVVQTDAGCDSTVTLNLTIYNSVATTDVRSSETPITWDGVTYSESTNTPIDSLRTTHGCDSIVTLEFTLYEPGIIPSTFHVSAGTTVQFSKGNLQYMGSTDTWRFAEHQYDYVGNAAGNTAPSASQANWIDLFGWATSGWNSGANSYRPYATSTSYGDYYIRGGISNSARGVYAHGDWGIYNPISNAENARWVWRTLTQGEWSYLLNTRAASNVNGVANARYCKAVVNGVNGLIVFPDSYTHPAIVPQPTVINNGSAAFSSNRYTREQFAQMEGRGVVFLPASGDRWGTSVGSVNSIGRYWSTTVFDYYRCYDLYFDNGGFNAGDNPDRARGCAVRLVKGSDLTHCGYEYKSGVDVRHACDSMTWIDGIRYTVSNNSVTHVVRTAAGCDSTVTLNLTIHPSKALTDVRMSETPISWAGNVYSENTTTPVDSLHTVYGCDSVVTLNLTIVERGKLPGVFRVSGSKTVVFSKGNLQYRSNTNTWRFAEHQYDIVGNAAANNAPSASATGWMDLFGWGTSGWVSGANSYRPYSTSTTNGDYYPGGSSSNNLTGSYIRADWGVYNPISNAENVNAMWRTLTNDEWVYLVNTRTTSNVNGVSNARYARATVNGRGGLILFPDSYTHPATVPQPVNINSNAGFGSNNYTVAQFAQMEAAGVVFLPAAGYRNGTSISYVGERGHYWSSIRYDGSYSRYFYFANDMNSNGYSDRRNGYSVRLVQDNDVGCGYLPRVGTDVQVVCDSLRWIDGVKYTANNNTATHVVRTHYGCDSTVTLNLTILNPTGAIDYHFADAPYTWMDGHTYSASNTTARDTIVNAVGCDSVVILNLTYVPEGSLPGAFSVSAGNQVRFSKGNLQYQGIHDSWRFAALQYDVVGNNLGNTDPSMLQGSWMDLFGWGTSGWNGGANAYMPYSISTTASDYYAGGSSANNLSSVAANADWGVHNAISNGGNAAGQWRTMTSSEWVYIFNTRTASTVNGTANARYCKATVAGVTGIILFPDSYTHPAGVTQPTSINTADAAFSTNVYTAAQFAKMEIFGVVFLPTAGWRSGNTVSGVGTGGRYWSSTHVNDSYCYGVGFDGSGLNPSGNDVGRYYGFSVRLVRAF